jgi:hypothetical protein
VIQGVHFMSRKSRWFLGTAVLLAGLAGCCICGKGDHAAVDPDERTGHPYEVSCLAHPSDTGHYIGYEVGGGAACHADGPFVDEGTWGWDYWGLCLPARVALDWWHGKYQGGYGTYKVDGPRPVECIQQRND